jgi:rhamnogalacturonan endolyase
MANLRNLSLWIYSAVLVSWASAIENGTQSKGFLKQLDSTTWIFGNDVWNLTQGRQYATKLLYKDKDLVGEAVGHYVSYSEDIASFTCTHG